MIPIEMIAQTTTKTSTTTTLPTNAIAHCYNNDEIGIGSDVSNKQDVFEETKQEPAQSYSSLQLTKSIELAGINVTMIPIDDSNNHSSSSNQNSNEKPEKLQDKPETASVSHDGASERREIEKLGPSYNAVAKDALTSLFAQVNKVIREVDQLIFPTIVDEGHVDRSETNDISHNKRASSPPVNIRDQEHRQQQKQQQRQQVMPSFSLGLKYSESSDKGGDSGSESTSSNLMPQLSSEEGYLDQNIDRLVDVDLTKGLKSEIYSEQIENEKRYPAAGICDTLDNLDSKFKIDSKNSNQNNAKLFIQDHSNVLLILHHLIEKRKELKTIDKQLFNIMTHYLMQLELSASDASSPDVSPTAAEFGTIIMHPQLSLKQQNLAFTSNQHPWLNHKDSLNYSHYKLNHNFNSINDSQLMDGVIDLSQMSSKLNEQSISSSSSKSQQTITCGGIDSTNSINTGHKSSGSLTTAGIVLEKLGLSAKLVESQGLKKSFSVNLKKSRLLGANLSLASNEQTKVQDSTQTRDFNDDSILAYMDRTSPLNLLKRYATLPSATMASSLSRSSSISMMSGENHIETSDDRLLGFQQQSSTKISTSSNSIGSPIFSLAPTLAASNVMPTSISVSCVAKDDDEVAINRLKLNHKKFRRMSQITCDQSRSSTALISSMAHNHSNNLLPDIESNNMNVLNAVFRHQQQQQQQQHLLSEYLYQQSASSSPVISPIARSADDSTTPSIHSPDLRKIDRDITVYTREETEFDNRFIPIAPNQATACVLANKQYNKPSHYNLQNQQTNNSDTNNHHSVTITPAQLSSQNNLESVYATINHEDHQIVPVAVPITETQAHKTAYKCHVCGSGFEDRHRLQQHLSIHLNLHPSWFEEKTIKETMAQYESKRGDYLCTTCNLRFETTAEFDKHMQLHGDKPHRCELCNQDNKMVCFRYYRQLLTHLRSHCFLYSCRFVPDCKQTANRKDYLKLHILKHHLNNTLPEQYTICCH